MYQPEEFMPEQAVQLPGFAFPQPLMNCPVGQVIGEPVGVRPHFIGVPALAPAQVGLYINSVWKPGHFLHIPALLFEQRSRYCPDGQTSQAVEIPWFVPLQEGL